MELIDVINSSLIIFFAIVSATATFSYMSYKLKDRTRIKSPRVYGIQSSETAGGIYPKMLNVNTNYKIPGEVKEKSSGTRRLNIFRFYSFNLNEKMHKLRLSVNR
jgi:hypothetical protein